MLKKEKNIDIETLRNSPKSYFTPTDISPFLEIGPYAISLLARDKPELIPFPFLRSGNRTKFPKKAFLDWYDANVGQ